MLKKNVKSFLLITLGCVLYSVGFVLFISPNHLAPGGVTGISVILSKFIPLGEGTLILLMNIPLLIIGLWKFGKSFLVQTVYATVVSALMMEGVSYVVSVAPVNLIPTTDLLLAGIVGGVVVGCGMGLIFRCGGTTGGTDIIVKLVRLRYPHIRTGKMFIIFDAMVVAASAIAFRNVEIALYAALTLVSTSLSIDYVLYGTDGARLVYIITDKHDEISKKLLALDVGVTVMKGIGAYTGNDKDVLMAAVRKQAFPKVRQTVSEIDEESFMIVSSASEIFGKIFKRNDKKEFC
ncbi:MAG: YitT family protein [Clostridia bacterium]|nr:YitT family protein [Clostridia bacterium]